MLNKYSHLTKGQNRTILVTIIIVIVFILGMIMVIGLLPGSETAIDCETICLTEAASDYGCVC